MLKKMMLGLGMLVMMIGITGCDAAEIVGDSLGFAGNIVSLFS
jgi:hypothetical protein